MESYKKSDLTLTKSLADPYHYTSAHRVLPQVPRFVYKNGVWEQTAPGKTGEALIMCAGDLMCEPVMSEAYYFDGRYFFLPCFKYVKKLFAQSDLAVANLETMVTDSFPYAHEMHYVEFRNKWRYLCNAPTAYLDALRYAGFDAFAMANNHCCDLGYDGIRETLDNVRGRGFMTTGAFKEKNEPRALHIRLNGIRIALLSYTEFINGKLDQEVLTEEGAAVMTNRLKEDVLRSDIRNARAEGAELVLVYVHFHGIEYSNEILDTTRACARLVADCGADIIMGSHMHAVQGYEAITASDGRSVPVIYSLSNFICSDYHPETRDSVIYCVRLKRENGKVVIAEENYIPCCNVEGLDRSGDIIFPALSQYREWPGFGNTDAVLAEAKERIRAVMGDGLAIRE